MSQKNIDATKQYFIAIVPPSPVYQHAQEFKNYFKDHFHSKASLNSPPHITLHMPFRWKERKEPELVESLQRFFINYDALVVTIKNFACFSPKVIFMDVEKSTALSELQSELFKFCKREFNLFNADYKDLPFHPHLTLAFRDLKKPAFIKAWEEFKDKKYQTEFQVTDIILLKHNSKVWEVFTRFALRGASTVG